jgi:hypothetical protein
MSSRERKGENGQWRVVAVVELEKREARFCPFFFVIALYYFGLSQERKNGGRIANENHYEGAVRDSVSIVMI